MMLSTSIDPKSIEVIAEPRLFKKTKQKGKYTWEEYYIQAYIPKRFVGKKILVVAVKQ